MGKETECNVCYAYIPVDEEAKDGDFIYCSYCGTQLMIKFNELLEHDDGTPKIETEEDWG